MKTEKAIDFMNLANELGNRNRDIWIKRRCPWCHEFKMYLKFNNYKYECKNCERKGDIEEVKNKYFSDMMEEKTSVSGV
jgi:glutaredoxin